MIGDFELQPLREAQFIKASLATYTQDGTPKDWEVVEAHDSVAILIYHREHEAFVLVRQFRPAVYLNNNDGMTVELCAGLVDKDKSLAQIAREEILEECGYDVPLETIERITAFHTSVGFAGSRQTLYYAEVDEAMHVNEGGGIDQEQIEVIELPVVEAEAFIYDESIAKTPGLMFAFLWWQRREWL
jgi:UDP-sugar diphosphatase